MLYETISEPLFIGSFHNKLMELAVAVARSDTTAPGLEDGVMHDAIALNGPIPALFRAYKHKTNSNILIM